jgi:hypothetical protein
MQFHQAMVIVIITIIITMMIMFRVWLITEKIKWFFLNILIFKEYNPVLQDRNEDSVNKPSSKEREVRSRIIFFVFVNF